MNFENLKTYSIMSNYCHISFDITIDIIKNKMYIGLVVESFDVLCMKCVKQRVSCTLTI